MIFKKITLTVFSFSSLRGIEFEWIGGVLLISPLLLFFLILRISNVRIEFWSCWYQIARLNLQIDHKIGSEQRWWGVAVVGCMRNFYSLILSSFVYISCFDAKDCIILFASRVAQVAPPLHFMKFTLWVYWFPGGNFGIFLIGVFSIFIFRNYDFAKMNFKQIFGNNVEPTRITRSMRRKFLQEGEYFFKTRCHRKMKIFASPIYSIRS